MDLSRPKALQLNFTPMTEHPSQTHAHSKNPNISAFNIVPHTVLSLGYLIKDFKTGTWMALKQNQSMEQGSGCSGGLFHSVETLEWLLLQTAEAKIRLSQRHCQGVWSPAEEWSPLLGKQLDHRGLLQRCGCFVECLVVNLGKRKLQILMNNGTNNHRSPENIVK